MSVDKSLMSHYNYIVDRKARLVKFELYSEKNLRQLKAAKLKFLHNCHGFLEAYKFPISFLIIAAAIDCMTTSHFMLLSSPEAEMHPHIRFVSCLLGPIWGPILGKVYQCALGMFIVIWLRKYAQLILWGTASLYIFGSWFNVFITGALDWLFLA
jgi:hypothetical protein